MITLVNFATNKETSEFHTGRRYEIENVRNVAIRNPRREISQSKLVVGPVTKVLPADYPWPHLLSLGETKDKSAEQLHTVETK